MIVDETAISSRPVTDPHGDPAALRAASVEAVEAGDFRRALDLFDEILVLERCRGDADAVDRTVCERAAIVVELGEAQTEVPALRDILVRSGDDLNCCRAAYTLARVHELEKGFRKALFYGQIARDRADRTSNTSWQARCHNLLGNLLLAESRMKEAVEEYEHALALMPSGEEVWAAHVWDNLGYCRVLQRRTGEGFELLIRALRTFRRYGARPYQLESHLDLSFAYLEIDRPRAALRHGETALRLASELEDAEARKNALYLCGQAAILCGDRDLARFRFAELQSGFYQDLPGVDDFLLEVDVRSLVNLKA